MYIIAGLGNPGVKYEKTRHNMGFRAIDRIAAHHGISVNRGKFRSLIGEGRIAGEKVVLVKPQTFMNLSGEALRSVVDFYKVPEENIILIYDDIDLPLGNIRIRKSGGPGTHNGMRSVVTHLGTCAFPRVRIGVGGGGSELVAHVIGSVPKEEQVVLDEAAEAAALAAEAILEDGPDLAMNRHNTKKADARDED